MTSSARMEPEVVIDSHHGAVAWGRKGNLLTKQKVFKFQLSVDCSLLEMNKLVLDACVIFVLDATIFTSRSLNSSNTTRDDYVSLCTLITLCTYNMTMEAAFPQVYENANHIH
ncbi:hypothetical protein SLA2020_116650 [Shorea laevis]